MTEKTVETGATRRAELDVLRTLPELLTHHLEIRPELPIYTFWNAANREWITWNVRETCEHVDAWRHGFAGSGLYRGDRVAMLLPNGIDAVCFDQAALAVALTPVPLHAIDTPGSSAYILNDSGARVLVTTRKNKWDAIRAADHIVSVKLVVLTDEVIETVTEDGVRIISLANWLEENKNTTLPTGPEPTDLAALVYTSGTTGRPKGVMLTHRNILSNIVGVLEYIWPEPDDVWLSFLPFSHTFERTTTYYAALGCGSRVAFNRSIGLIQEDMKIIAPTVMMSVPRIYEKIYSKIHDKLATKSPIVRTLFNWTVDIGWRRFCRRNGIAQRGSAIAFLDGLAYPILDRIVAKPIREVFGGRPRIFIAGGAAFNPSVSRTFLGLGVEILQGYGMTESSPIIAVNKLGANHPSTVGLSLRNIHVRVGENDELQVQGPSVMQGYWNRPEDTKAVFTHDGYLKTGDQADIYADGHVRIKGRIKEIIVTSTGEKIAPADLEQAIENDHLFEQSMAVGENRPYLGVLAVVNQVELERLCRELKLDPKDPEVLSNKDLRAVAVKRIKAATASFPTYAVPRNVRLIAEPWTIDNGLLTPTLKLKRAVIRARYSEAIDELYGNVRR